jgi:hypothetical protein
MGYWEWYMQRLCIIVWSFIGICSLNFLVPWKKSIWLNPKNWANNIVWFFHVWISWKSKCQMIICWFKMIELLDDFKATVFFWIIVVIIIQLFEFFGVKPLKESKHTYKVKRPTHARLLWSWTIESQEVQKFQNFCKGCHWASWPLVYSKQQPQNFKKFQKFQK